MKKIFNYSRLFSVVLFLVHYAGFDLKAAPKDTMDGSPIVFYNSTLFTIYTRLGPFTKEQRAKAIEAKIKSLANDLNFSGDSLIILTSDASTELIYKEIIIASITLEDARIMGVNLDLLATQYKTSIIHKIQIYQDETSTSTMVKNIGLIALIIVLSISVIFLIHRLFLYTENKIKTRMKHHLKGIILGSHKIITANGQARLFIFLNSFIKWVFISIAIYLIFPVGLSIFPFTKGISETLLGYLLTPLTSFLKSISNYLPNLFTLVILFILFRLGFKALNFLKNELSKDAIHLPHFHKDWIEPTFRISRILLIAFMLVVAFPYLPGSNSPVFQGISVFIGFLLTFSSGGSFSNIIAGFILTYMRAFKIGDRVKINDITGDIIEKGLLVIRIRTTKNEDITIPNSAVMKSNIKNYSTSSQNLGLIVYTTVTIGYDVSWQKVHEVLIAAALKTDHILSTPLPYVLQTSLDDFYASYQINAYTNEPNKQTSTYSSLHQHIQDALIDAGIEILSPHYQAVRDGSSLAVPPDALPKNYVPPTFGVHID